MVCRSAWLSGRTDPLGRSSSSKGQGENRRWGVLISGGASRRPAPGLAGHAVGEVAASWCARWSAGARGCGRWRIAWYGPGRWPCGLAGGWPAGRVVRLGAKGPVRVGDVVGMPVLLDLGGGLAPGPPAPSRRRHRPEGLQDIAGAVSLNGRKLHKAQPVSSASTPNSRGNRCGTLLRCHSSSLG
jgi:hypothetical protein